MTRPSTLLSLLGLSLLGCFVASDDDDEIGDTVETDSADTTDTSDTADSSTTEDTTDTADTADTDTTDTTDTTEETSGVDCEGRGGGLGSNEIMDELFPQPDLIESCCDPFLQDCGAGQKCVPYGESGGTWAGNKCVDVQGDGQPGDSCIYGGIVGANDDCGPDTFCFGVEQVALMTIGICTPLCGGTMADPLCEPGTSCLISNNDALSVCVPSCDPLLQDCGADLACYYANEAFACLPTTDEIPTGEPCEFSNQCAAGNLCAPGAALPSCNGDYCCTALCNLVDPICSQVGTACESVYLEGQAPPGYEDVGICLAP
jgi:hypothetical protein